MFKACIFLKILVTVVRFFFFVGMHFIAHPPEAQLLKEQQNKITHNVAASWWTFD